MGTTPDLDEVGIMVPHDVPALRDKLRKWLAAQPHRTENPNPSRVYNDSLVVAPGLVVLVITTWVDRR